MARRRLPAFVFEYLDGGAEDEITLARNRSAFGEYALCRAPWPGADVPKVEPAFSTCLRACP